MTTASNLSSFVSRVKRDEGTTDSMIASDSTEIEIERKIIQRYRNSRVHSDLSFKLWNEVTSSQGYRSRRFWQLNTTDGGEIPEGVSRVYFVNVGLPEGLRRWYTVVTVKNGENEVPFAVSESTWI